MADDLGKVIEARGRPVIRATIEGFLRPRAERYRRGVDSPEGCYHDSFDFDALFTDLLDPLGPDGDRNFRHAVYDRDTDTALAPPITTAPADAVLLFDGVFLMRPELIAGWDLRIFVSAPFEVTLSRALERDRESLGSAARVEERFRDRYGPSQQHYFDTVRPTELADVIVQNGDLQHPAWQVRTRRARTMSVRDAQQQFLEAAVERLAADDRVAAVLLVGSAGRGEADEWSDLDIDVIADDEHSPDVLSNPHEAEQFGDLLAWVDCSFNAVVGGTMAFSRYGSDAGVLMVDWHVFPRSLGRITDGARILWKRPDIDLQRFDGNVGDLVTAGPRRTIPPYSRQQRAEWELCMIDIAAARPPRGQDGRELHRYIGVEPDTGPDPVRQLDGLRAHLLALQPLVAPRALAASLERLERARQAVSSVTQSRGGQFPITAHD